MKKLRLLTEELFTVLALVIYSGGPLPVLLSPGEDTGVEPDLAPIRLVFLITYVVFFCLLIFHWKRALCVISKGKIILALVGLALFSSLWSVDFSITIKRSIALIGTTLFGFYLVARYPLHKQIQLLAQAFFIIILFSILFAVVLPQYGIMSGTHEGALRGIYTHKNTLGKVMVLGTITFTILSLTSGKKRAIFQIGLVLSVLLILLSTSKTSLVIMMVLMSSALFFQVLRWKDTVLIPIFLMIVNALILATILIVPNITSIILALGRDPTLSGRTDLWLASWDMLKDRLFFGYGYYTFWDSSNGAKVWLEIGWPAPHSHNGLIELGLDLGILGVFIFLVGLFKYIIRSFSYIRLNKIVESIWPLLYIELLVCVNITESTLLVRNNIFWVLYIASVLTMYTSYTSFGESTKFSSIPQ